MLVSKDPKLSTTELNWGKKCLANEEMVFSKNSSKTQCRVLKVTGKALSPKYEVLGLMA